MKKISLTLLTVAALVFTVNAGTLFDDNFTVSGGGDVNFEYATRQTGSAAPQPYAWANGPCTVTNGGPNAGKLNMDGAPVTSWNAIDHNFTESADFSVEYELTRLPTDTNGWDSISFGKDGIWKTPNGPEYGMGIIFYESGWYQVFDRGVLTGNFNFAELAFVNNATLKIRVVVSQQDFSGGSDAQVALFINDKPYPVQNAGATKYTYTSTGGFTNNFITFLTLATEANLDNLRVLTPPGNVINTAAWTSDADSEISSAKTYTHAIDCGNAVNTTINGVTFTGTAGANSGANWEVRTDTGTALPAVETTQYFLVPNITGQGQFIVTNVFFDLLNNVDNPSLTLTGLTPAQQYILTLYSQGLGGPSYAYVATSDGAAITVQDSSEYGPLNGELMKYHYTANDDGVFSLSTTATNQVWGIFAFSNVEIPEPVFIIGCISLLGLAFLRRK